LSRQTRPTDYYSDPTTFTIPLRNISEIQYHTAPNHPKVKKIPKKPPPLIAGINKHPETPEFLLIVLLLILFSSYAALRINFLKTSWKRSLEVQAEREWSALRRNGSLLSCCWSAKELLNESQSKRRMKERGVVYLWTERNMLVFRVRRIHGKVCGTQ
jgi:hypothetical protein